MSDEKKTEPKKEGLGVFFLLLLGMVILWAASGWIINWLTAGDSTRRGTFGDMFGAINALFSGVALAGVVYAIILQRRELQLQRQELEETREELRRSAEAQEKSEKHLVQQAEALASTAKSNSLAYVPTIICSASINSTNSSEVIFGLSNPSINAVAYDVDVLVVGSYDEKANPKKIFMTKNLVKDGLVSEFSKRTIDDFEKTTGKIYSVFDRLVYPLLPQRMKVISRLSFPERPFGFYALLQFRDMLGTNYHQLYFFMARTRYLKGYNIGAIEPKILTTNPRIINNKGEVVDSLSLMTVDGSPLPEYIQKEFLTQWTDAISCRFFEANPEDFEDRGSWHNL